MSKIERINNKATEQDKTEALLFMLPRKSGGAFKKFCMALKETYDGVPLYKDLAEELETTGGSPDNEEERVHGRKYRIRYKTHLFNI